jgi:hypothetical protein
MLSHYKLTTVNKAGSRAYGMNLVLVDGGKYKDMIASRMRKPNGKGSWMVHKDVDDEYCQQVTAEQKVTERSSSGTTVTRWVPKSSHADNHYLDAEVYAMAAADYLNVRTLFLRQESEPDEPASRTSKNNAEQQQNASDWLQHSEPDWFS